MFLGTLNLSKTEDIPDSFVVGEIYEYIAGSTETHQERFDWDNTLKKSAHNSSLCNRLAVFAKAHGADIVADCKAQLELVELGDLEARFRTRFDSLRATKRGTAKADKTDGTMTTSQQTNRAPLVSGI